MSLTENYIVPDFYYTETGIPILCNNKFKLETTRSQIINRQKVLTNNNNSNLSLTTGSVLSPPSKSYKNSNEPSMLHLTQQQPSTSSSTSLTTESCNSTLLLKLTKNNRVKKFDNIDKTNNNCDKNSKKINLKNFEIPKKLLTKRGTIYQTTDQITETTKTTDRITSIEATLIETPLTTTIKKSDENISILNTESNDNSNCHNSNSTIEFLKKDNKCSDKESKTILNNIIKEMQKRDLDVLRNRNYQSQQLYGQQQPDFLIDQLNW